MLARDVMTEDPMTLRPNNPLRDALVVLRTLEIRHLPIVDRAHVLVGMLSDRDFRAPALVPEDPQDRRLERPIADLMTGDVLSVQLDAPLSDVIDLMIEQRIGAVPVTDAEGQLVGIVSYVDVLRELRAAADT